MTVFEAARASSNRHVLAEGPVWSTETSRLLWVDIEEGKVFVGRIAHGAVEQTHQFDFDGKVGAVVPGDDGSLLIAAQSKLVVIDADGSRRDGPVLVPDASIRSNDGGCDPAGRFLIGTLHMDDREGEDTLQRLEFDGSLTTIDTDLSISNGLAWSPDGTLMYSTDTLAGVIWVRDYDPATGDYGARREHVKIDAGFPDGIAMDARGHLWVAIWGESEVRSFTTNGEPEHVVRVPVPHVSSVAFVGDKLDALLITTASRDLDSTGLARFPDAGRLFLVDVGAVGTPTSPWKSSALTK